MQDNHDANRTKVDARSKTVALRMLRNSLRVIEKCGKHSNNSSGSISLSLLDRSSSNGEAVPNAIAE
jgi:hypothetical protein